MTPEERLIAIKQTLATEPTQENIQNAVDELNLMSSDGFIPATKTLGFLYRELGYLRESHWCFFKAMGTDDDEATYEVAINLALGRGVEPGPKKAQMILQGLVRSNPKPLYINDLALFYLHGYAHEPNPKEAFSLFEQLAHEQFPPAQNNLAICFWNGAGCRKDYALAFYWLFQSAKLGYSKSFFDLGELVGKVYHNKTLATDLYYMGADLNNKECMQHLVEHKILRNHQPSNFLRTELTLESLNQTIKNINQKPSLFGFLSKKNKE